MSVSMPYCPKCLSPMPQATTLCPRCGCNGEAAVNQSNWLPVGTLLHETYLIGLGLGQGGFGITYAGLDRNLGVKVAVKEFYPEGYASREQTGHSTVQPIIGDRGKAFLSWRDRFVEEAQTLARFAGDPSIVRVMNFFYENDTAYIVMEYVEGETLKAYCGRGGKLSAAECLTLLRPLMFSLNKVHEAGLLHRDISPDNIMLQPDGSCKLLDFGAARAMSLAGEHSNTINVKHGFAPLEQYRTRGTQGPFTDVYAFCATIYWLTTGITPPQAIDRLTEDTPITPPNDLGADFTPGQQAALLHGLEIQAKDRILDMEALNRELCAGLPGYDPFAAREAGRTAARQRLAQEGSFSMGIETGTRLVYNESSYIHPWGERLGIPNGH